MTETILIENMGIKGVNTDVAPWSLPPEFITTGNNFRIYDGSIYSSGGYKAWSQAPEQFYPGHLHHVGSTSADYWVVLGRDKVYAFDGQTWLDISSAVGYDSLGEGDEQNWTTCELGQIPVFNNPQTHPEFWSPQSVGQILQPLQFDASNTWADVGLSAQVVRSHKNFLIAMNIQEGVDELHNTIRISTAADINGLPYTWDETDISGLAVKFQLGGDSGQIIDGLSLRDTFVVYSEQGIDILEFVGGQFFWKSKELSSTVGLLSKNSIAEVKGIHYFIGDGDIYSNDGTNLKSILYGRIKKQFTRRVNPDFYYRSFVIRNNTDKEVWFCVPVDEAEYPNIAFIYNWEEGSWSVRNLPYEMDTLNNIPITSLTYASYGPQVSPLQTWDNWEGTWDSQTGVWGSRNTTPLDSVIVGCILETFELVFLDEQTGATSDFDPAKIERTGYPLAGHQQVTTITRVYPLMVGTTPVEIQFGSQDYPGSPIRWKTSIPFRPDLDRKIDLRTTGELHCWRITSLQDYDGVYTEFGVGNWQMSGMLIEYQEDGLR